MTLEVDTAVTHRDVLLLLLRALVGFGFRVDVQADRQREVWCYTLEHDHDVHVMYTLFSIKHSDLMRGIRA